MRNFESGFSRATIRRHGLGRPCRLLAALLLAALPLAMRPVPVAAQPQVPMHVPQALPQVMATGVGELRALPDMAVIRLAVEAVAPDAARAGQDNAARMTSLRQALERLGIAAQDIATTGYSLRNEQRQPDRTARDKPPAFVARNGIRVTVRALDRVGATIDAALAGGANQVDDITDHGRRGRRASRPADRTVVGRRARRRPADVRRTGIGDPDQRGRDQRGRAGVRALAFRPGRTLREATAAAACGRALLPALVAGRWISPGTGLPLRGLQQRSRAGGVRWTRWSHRRRKRLQTSQTVQPWPSAASASATASR